MDLKKEKNISVKYFELGPRYNLCYMYKMQIFIDFQHSAR